MKIKVIHKKGDVERAENYRPICTLPAEHKCFQHLCMIDFSTILTDDNHSIIWRHTGCWNQKAKSEVSRCGSRRSTSQKRDTIRHDALWKALARFEVDVPHISLFKRLNADQQATVLTDAGSNVLKMQKMTKQGDQKVLYCSTRCSRLL